MQFNPRIQINIYKIMGHSLSKSEESKELPRTPGMFADGEESRNVEIRLWRAKKKTGTGAALEDFGEPR